MQRIVECHTPDGDCVPATLSYLASHAGVRHLNSLTMCEAVCDHAEELVAEDAVWKEAEEQDDPIGIGVDEDHTSAQEGRVSVAQMLSGALDHWPTEALADVEVQAIERKHRHRLVDGSASAAAPFDYGVS